MITSQFKYFFFFPILNKNVLTLKEINIYTPFLFFINKEKWWNNISTGKGRGKLGNPLEGGSWPGLCDTSLQTSYTEQINILKKWK